MLFGCMPEKTSQAAEAGASRNGFGAWCADLAVRHRLIANLLIHNFLFALALLMAYLVRFEAFFGEVRQVTWFSEFFLPSLPFFLVGKSVIFGLRRLFRGWWQYAGLRDVVNILFASWLFVLAAYVIIVILVKVPPMLLQKTPLRGYSRGVLLLDFILTVFLVCTARLGVRFYHEESRPIAREGVRRVLIVGAGDAAETLLREIHRMRVERYRVVGLVDDDPAKQGIYIHNIPVLGTIEELKEICAERNIFVLE